MDSKEKQRFKDEFKQPIALLGVGLLVLGLLITYSGIILDAKWIQHIGVIMVFISWFTTSIVSWKRGKTNFSTSAFLALLGIVGVTAYGYFFFS
ncbi:Fe3+-siderophore ABC transporter permease [Bhargavaea cecembensis]|uniref:Fe3+-siderophore ABC transporter permease n=1 Tax=Bhargavaea cecembensis TaxID=394098 RepID=UPI00211D1788|nr:Fe3+-siderophore ABC transporter permease [Bhargavaea cecembensis]